MTTRVVRAICEAVFLVSVAGWIVAGLIIVPDDFIAGALGQFERLPYGWERVVPLFVLGTIVTVGSALGWAAMTLLEGLSRRSVRLQRRNDTRRRD